MSDRESDRVIDAVRSARPLDFTPVIDTHGHFGAFHYLWVPGGDDPDAVLREMEAYGIRMACLSASGLAAAGALSRANDDVLRAVKRHPGRILGYCTLSSVRPERQLDELKRCYDLGLRVGVKMHRYNQPAYKLADKFLDPIFEFLSRRRLIYINHTLGPLDELREVARRWPDVTFLNGHGDVNYATLGADVPNVFANVCAMIQHGDIADLVRRCGAKHLLLGSDFGLFQAGFGIGPVAFADIPEEDKLDILGRNALAIFERMEWWAPSRLSV